MLIFELIEGSLNLATTLAIAEKKILKRRGMISAVILFIINLLFITVELRTLTNALTLAVVSEVIILSSTK